MGPVRQNPIQRTVRSVQCSYVCAVHCVQLLHTTLPRPHDVRWGPSSPSPKKGGGTAAPQFSAHVYCGQTAGWIKMKLGMEVGLGTGHIFVRKGSSCTSPEGGQPPIFGPCIPWSNAFIDQDATWYGGRPRPRRHC